MSNRLIVPRNQRFPLDYTLKKLGLFSDLQYCLDVGSRESYSGSGQLWNDLSGLGTNFMLGSTSGASADDPTFTGNAGGLDRDTYWAFDGGDHFLIDGTAIPSWANALHQDNAIFSLFGWVYIAAPGSFYRILGNYGNGAFGSSNGITFSGTSSETLNYAVADGSGGGALVATTTATYGTGWVFMGMSINEAQGANGLMLQVNGSQEFFTSTYVTPSGSAASAGFRLYTNGSTSNNLPNGGRASMQALWLNRQLTAAQMMSVYQATRGRHGV